MKKKLLSILKKMPLFFRNPIIRNNLRLDESKIENVIFKVADNKEELEQAYKLVHDVYLNEDYTDDNSVGLRIKLINALPNTTTFIGKIGNQVIITMTLFEDSNLKLPMDELYNDELNQLRNQGRKIMEVGGLASHPDHRKNNQMLPTALVKIMLTYSMKYLKIDDQVIMVNPKHVWVYESLFLFEKIGMVKYYQNVKNNPAVPLKLDLRTCSEKAKKIYQHKPFKKNLYYFLFQMNGSFIKLPKVKRPLYIWTPEMLSYFFEYKTNLFQLADKRILAYIKEKHLMQKEFSSLRDIA